MPTIDTIARANLAQTNVQLHRMTAALFSGIDALDVAFKCVERMVENLSGPDIPDAVTADLKALREARGRILQMALNLR